MRPGVETERAKWRSIPRKSRRETVEEGLVVRRHRAEKIKTRNEEGELRKAADSRAGEHTNPN
jgi:hypothetical protein